MKLGTIGGQYFNGFLLGQMLSLPVVFHAAIGAVIRILGGQEESFQIILIHDQIRHIRCHGRAVDTGRKGMGPEALQSILQFLTVGREVESALSRRCENRGAIFGMQGGQVPCGRGAGARQISECRVDVIEDISHIAPGGCRSIVRAQDRAGRKRRRLILSTGGGRSFLRGETRDHLGLAVIEELEIFLLETSHSTALCVAQHHANLHQFHAHSQGGQALLRRGRCDLLYADSEFFAGFERFLILLASLFQRGHSLSYRFCEGVQVLRLLGLQAGRVLLHRLLAENGIDLSVFFQLALQFLGIRGSTSRGSRCETRWGFEQHAGLGPELVAVSELQHVTPQLFPLLSGRDGCRHGQREG